MLLTIDAKTVLCIMSPQIIATLATHNESVYMDVLTLLLKFMSVHGLPDQFPEDGSILFDTEATTTSSPACSLSQLESGQDSVIKDTYFWLEGVCQAVAGIIGIGGNIFAMKIFVTGRNKFNTIFYKLLLCLLFCQTCYIALRDQLFKTLCHKKDPLIGF